jgi:hypothetical protein
MSVLYVINSLAYNFVRLRLLLWSLIPLQLNIWRSVLFLEETGVPGENKVEQMDEVFKPW